MTKEVLRRVQLQILEIAHEIKRVCENNQIPYWLEGGSCLGAVRHGGFIPWDDDLDIGMMRCDYERFRRIADRELGAQYIFQDWHTDAAYPLPYGKVRKRGTRYVEAKSNPSAESGFFVDVFPYDDFPDHPSVQHRLIRSIRNYERLLLMKCHYTPWIINGAVSWKRRIGYLPYQICSLFFSKEEIIKAYEKISLGYADTAKVYAQDGTAVYVCDRSCISSLIKMDFEKSAFPVPCDTDSYLTSFYGDYMKMPPENERENRHQIVDVDFGD